jgi:hypothetical protein
MRKSKYRNGHSSSTIPEEISCLSAMLQRRSKLDRARLADSIQRGKTKITSFTAVEAARLCGVSSQYIYHVRRTDAPAAPIVQLAAE